MRVSELLGKDVIDMHNGIKLNTLETCELLFDEQSGRIISLLMPDNPTLLHIFQEHKLQMIPWGAIKKIGTELILVDYTEKRQELFE